MKKKFLILSVVAASIWAIVEASDINVALADNGVECKTDTELDPQTGKTFCCVKSDRREDYCIGVKTDYNGQTHQAACDHCIRHYFN